MHVFTKQPSEIIPISMDFQYLLNDTETISSMTATAVDDDGTNVTSTIIHNYAISGDICKVTVKAGTDEIRYKITIKITTNESNIYEEDVFMKVYET